MKIHYKYSLQFEVHDPCAPRWHG